MSRPAASQHTRRLAAEILNRVTQQRHTLDHWLDWADARHMDLSVRDRAFVRALVYGTLRWQSRLDWIIDHLAVRPAASLDPPVRTILRMGLFQLFHMDRIPVSAAVNTSVELAKQFKRHWAAGFINKVLRRAAGEFDQLAWPDTNQDPVKALAVDQAFPQWMIHRWIQRWGFHTARHLCQAFNTIGTTTLRTNALKTDRESLIKALVTHGLSAHATTFAPEGVVVSGQPGPLTMLPGFREGWFQIQDEAAQLVTHLLNPQPGQVIWDACAGLGTKTGHMAQLMGNQGGIVATDIHPHKLSTLMAEMQRLGVTNVECRPLDLAQSSEVDSLPLFDGIMLDAPCSGMGVIRKNPDTKWSLAEADLDRHGQLQRRLLASVAGRLKPGGILVYSVCSMEPEENQMVMEDFLRNHPEFDIYPMAGRRVADVMDLTTADGWLRTIPHEHDMDGFFAAAVIKMRP